MMGALPSIKLWLDNGTLHEGGAVARSHDVVERDAYRAVSRLLDGETINLELYADKLSIVRKALGASDG